MISKQEERKVTFIAAASSFVILAGVVVLLILWIIHVPNPPVFPDTFEVDGGGQESGGVEVSMGSPDASYSDYVFPTPVNENPVTNTASADNSVLISDQDGVNINEPKTDPKTSAENPKSNTNTNNTNTNTNPKKWGDALSNAGDGGNGSNTNGSGDDPGGSTGGPDFTTAGGNTGGNTGGKGPGTGNSFGTGRKAVVLPCRPNVTKKEGKVVVIIKVDKAGNVIEADPNGPGTDTSDPELKLQARQAALCTKFDACTECPAISKGTIIFDFGYGSK